MRCFFLLLLLPIAALAQSFTVDQVTSYPFPNELTAAKTGTHLAWAVNEQGKRNLYVAEGPSFTPRKLTNYTVDDGQELTSVTLSDDGKYVVYVRGGDHGSNWDPGLPVNPAFTPTPNKVQIYTIPFSGGAEPKLIGEGDHPAVSAAEVAFIRGGQAWSAPIDGSKPAKAMFTTRGMVGELNWSPNGQSLAFTTTRTDHAFIGVYHSPDVPITWIAPSFHRDRSPRWSPDGSQIAFVRSPGSGGAPQPLLVPRHTPWSIWTAKADGSEARELWKAPATLRGSVPSTQGGTNLNWGARLTFLSYEDGWPHLYSIDNGHALALTPGNFMAEYISMSADGKWLLFAGNTGPDDLDLDRRHIIRVAVDKPGIEVMTPGAGIETSPVMTGDGSTIAFLSATTSRPSVLAVKAAATSAEIRLVGANMIPADFPAGQFVTPKQVVFKSPDGVIVHGQLFEKAGGTGKKPGIIFVHGGPPRQMLLGWHYGDYYANSYAMNQYLANLGFVVLAVNYRLGIGYGYEFHHPEHAGAQGASEYIDVKAAGEWLARQPQVDPAHIGIYGGSYGGFLTAMALAKDSKLFAAGVDVHGVHDWAESRGARSNGDRFEKIPDLAKAAELNYKSSPIAYVNNWKSPVLFIHGDDDRNVQFNQTTDLLRRLDALNIPYESMVIVDDTHHFMRHGNQVRVDEATAAFLRQKLMSH